MIRRQWLAFAQEGGVRPSDQEYCYLRSSDTSIGRADLDGANASNHFVTGMTPRVHGIAVHDSHVDSAQYLDEFTDTDRGVFRLGLVGEVASPLPSFRIPIRRLPELHSMALTFTGSVPHLSHAK